MAKIFSGDFEKSNDQEDDFNITPSKPEENPDGFIRTKVNRMSKNIFQTKSISERDEESQDSNKSLPRISALKLLKQKSEKKLKTSSEMIELSNRSENDIKEKTVNESIVTDENSYYNDGELISAVNEFYNNPNKDNRNKFKS